MAPAAPPPPAKGSYEKLETVPFDIRYPHVNQTRNCYDNFVDYQKCVKYKGEGYEPCQYFKKVYQALCPHEWLERWQKQLKNEAFPHKI